MVRELGLERRETVWSLSAILLQNIIKFTLVREDWENNVNGNYIRISIYNAKHYKLRFRVSKFIYNNFVIFFKKYLIKYLYFYFYT